jgi:acetyl-CoA carboxylase biotin carboxyl carrier protein
MDLSYEDVQSILKIIDSSSIEELHIEIGDFKLVVRKRGAGREAGEGPAAPASEAVVSEATRPSRPRRADGVEVKAPMVGTFYRAPSPGAPPFVEVGSVVAEDDTVCIIEVMKLMNSIRAGCRARVVEICAENADLVEFGQTLMVIEPLS